MDAALPAPEQLSDSELLARYVQTGSQAAFEAIVERHTRAVYTTCKCILVDRQDAEDAAQATFLVLMQKARRLPSGIRLAGWLYLAARNSAQALRRAKSRREKRERDVAHMRTLSEVAERNELQARVDDALAALPALQRDAVVLHFLAGKSYADAAQEMNCPENTFHKRLTVALAKLRDRLRHRGTSMSVTALAVFLAQRASEAVPEGLSASIKSTCASGVAAPLILETVQGALSALAWMKIKTVLLSLAAACALVAPLTWAVMHLSAASSQALPAGVTVHQAAGPAAPVVPAPAIDQPGLHLDDRGLWAVIGNSSLKVTSLCAEFTLKTEQAGIMNFSGFMFHRSRSLAGQTATLRLTCTPMQGKGATYFIPYIFRKEPDLTDEEELQWTLQLAPNFAQGNARPVSAKTVYEIRVSSDHISLLANGVEVDGQAQALPADDVFIGFMVGAVDAPEGVVIRIDDVCLESSPASKPRVPQEF